MNGEEYISSWLRYMRALILGTHLGVQDLLPLCTLMSSPGYFSQFGGLLGVPGRCGAVFRTGNVHM